MKVPASAGWSLAPSMNFACTFRTNAIKGGEKCGDLHADFCYKRTDVQKGMKPAAESSSSAEPLDIAHFQEKLRALRQIHGLHSNIEVLFHFLFMVLSM